MNIVTLLYVHVYKSVNIQQSYSL